MQMPRRTTTLASLALVLAPVLSSCGFDYATDRDYTPGVGANNRSGQTDVLSGVVVSAEDGEGVFIASLANNSTSEPVTLTGITGEGVTVGDVAEVELAEEGFENLADGKKPITVSGDFEPGNFVTLALEFSNGEQVDIEVPVLRNCGYYAEVKGVPAGDDVCESGNDLEHEGEH